MHRNSVHVSLKQLLREESCISYVWGLPRVTSGNSKEVEKSKKIYDICYLYMKVSGVVYHDRQTTAIIEKPI